MEGDETQGLAVRQKILPNDDPFEALRPLLVDTAVTAADCCSTRRKSGLAKGEPLRSRTSLPWSVVTSGRCERPLTHVPTSPPGNHQCAWIRSGR